MDGEEERGETEEMIKKGRNERDIRRKKEGRKEVSNR